MKTHNIGIILVQFALACSGSVGSGNNGGSSSVGGSNSANTGGASGGTRATGGSSGGTTPAGGCAAGPVTFQVMPAPNAVTQWCVGQPGSCSGVTLDIRNSSGSLDLGLLCRISCDTCTLNECPPLACFMPTALTAQGYTQVWDGAYATSSTCGASGAACISVNCAAPGHYTVGVCGFPNPDPSSSNACEQASKTTTQTCVTTAFEVPATAPVVVTMPAD